jgi:glycosyltransferase involved in cell wall biosynthesis
MRVLMLSKALLVGQYQTKAEALARKPGVELTVVAPPSWRDERGSICLEKNHIKGYEFLITPLRFNGHYHIHFYPEIGEIFDRTRPDLIHLDEEPYNLATFHALVEARRNSPRARVLFFTWQNLPRSYPPPFSWMRAFVFANTDYALAGNPSAERVLRANGFTKPVRVIPQFGVDPSIFRPAPNRRRNVRFAIGFAARLVPEKGASLLLSALKQLERDWDLRIVGGGPERAKLEATAYRLGIASRVQFIPWQPSEQMPDVFQALDVLVAPSLSRPNWTEQFGRVLVEAMACGIPVIGSSAGEIPNVIGDAGLIFSEGNITELVGALRSLIDDPARAEDLRLRGRARVLDMFTQERIVDETYAVYRELVR